MEKYEQLCLFTKDEMGELKEESKIIILDDISTLTISSSWFDDNQLSKIFELLKDKVKSGKSLVINIV